MGEQGNDPADFLQTVEAADVTKLPRNEQAVAVFEGTRTLHELGEAVVQQQSCSVRSPKVQRWGPSLHEKLTAEGIESLFGAAVIDRSAYCKTFPIILPKWTSEWRSCGSSSSGSSLSGRNSCSGKTGEVSDALKDIGMGRLTTGRWLLRNGH